MCEIMNDWILSSGVGASLCKYAFEVKYNVYLFEYDFDVNVDVKFFLVYIVFDG